MKNKLSSKSDIRFNFLTKLFQADIRPELEEYINGELKGPLLVEFDPTTACNYTCPECISSNLLNKDKIPSERIESLINEFSLAGTKGIIFIGGGEPLAHSYMPKPIKQAFDLGMAVGLTTNGSLLDRHMETISNCVSWVRVSMDAATEETYLLFRPNKIKDSFAKVIKNMENLAKSKKGVLGYSFLIMKRPLLKATNPNTQQKRQYITNAHEIYKAAKIAKDIGCDYFEFKPMVDSDHYLLPFDQEMQKIIKEQYDKCRQLEDPSFNIIAPQSVEHLQYQDTPIQSKQYETCSMMDIRTCVTPSGIYPCPYHRGREDKKIGTIYEEEFHSFWKSDKRKESMKLINPKYDCEFYCNRNSLNIVLNSIKELHEQGIQILEYIEKKDHLYDPFF